MTQKYRIHRAADLPREATNVKVAVHRIKSVYGSMGTVLLGYRGKVYAGSDRGYLAGVGDVRERTELFPAFAKLSGITQSALRKARKDFLDIKSNERVQKHIDSLADSARRVGYKLVKVK